MTDPQSPTTFTPEELSMFTSLKEKQAARGIDLQLKGNEIHYIMDGESIRTVPISHIRNLIKLLVDQKASEKA